VLSTITIGVPQGPLLPEHIAGILVEHADVRAIARHQTASGKLGHPERRYPAHPNEFTVRGDARNRGDLLITQRNKRAAVVIGNQRVCLAIELATEVVEVGYPAQVAGAVETSHLGIEGRRVHSGEQDVANAGVGDRSGWPVEGEPGRYEGRRRVVPVVLPQRAGHRALGQEA
jgi:hypothetical protein